VDGKDPGIGAIDRCWFTDAFKCSTRRESAPEITAAAFDACRPHLERELSIVKPRLVVALWAIAR
jgi:uracil-DNA glycosylase